LTARQGRLRPAVETKSTRGPMGSLIKKRRKKMSKHKYRKRLRANRHKRKK
jgi:hypothetical protein